MDVGLKKVRLEMEIEEFQSKMPCPVADSCSTPGIGCNFFIAQTCEAAQEALVAISVCHKKPVALTNARRGFLQECL